MSHVLIVDDNVDAATTLAALVEMEGFSVACAHTLFDARAQLAMHTPDLVLLDLHLPDGNALTLFDDAGLLAQSQVVMITGHASLETSIQALRLGVADYVIKPLKPVQLKRILSRVVRPAAMQAELEDVQAEWQSSGRFGHLWGRTPAMQTVYRQIARVAGTAVSVLITGESGTGKEVVARTLHDLSRRRGQAFLAVNCGAIPPHLIESEVFGHEKGSFTGAERQHQGFFERASGGTLFLDEITEMPAELQVKLLRVLETGSYMRVGSTQALEADVRIVAATNRVPEQAVAQGRLREDLLYRLNVFPIALPPLRTRSEDTPLLAEKFLADIGQSEGAPKRFTSTALDKLAAYSWPGTVREVRNVVQRSYVMSEGPQITEEWLPFDAPVQSVMDGVGPSTEQSVSIPIGSTMAEAERQLILATFNHFKQQRERTASTLGISLKTLYNRLREYAEKV